MIEGRHYQNAYVTRDIEKWVTYFEKNAKVDLVLRHEGTQHFTIPAGGEQSAKLAFIWIDNLQYELIQPTGGTITMYSEALPADDGLQFHHVCMRVKEWDDFRARVDRQDYPIAIENSSGSGSDYLKYLYLDARGTLGHYLEYVWCTDELWQQMGGR